jgi:hypothetical protein
LRPPTLVGEISPGDGDEAYKRDEPEQPEDPLDCLPCAKYPSEQPRAAFIASLPDPPGVGQEEKVSDPVGEQCHGYQVA